MLAKFRVPIDPNRNPIHFQRYTRFKAGASVEQIAKADHVVTQTVQQSIDQVNAYREAFSIDFTNMAVGKTVTGVLPDAGKALKRALNAKTKVRDWKGRLREHHDHKTQIHAAEALTGMIEAIQPKGGKGLAVNVNATAGAQASNFNESTYKPGFEEKIDEIRARVRETNLLPREVGTTFDHDAEVIEGELEESAADESSEIEPETAAEASP